MGEEGQGTKTTNRVAFINSSIHKHIKNSIQERCVFEYIEHLGYPLTPLPHPHNHRHHPHPPSAPSSFPCIPFTTYYIRLHFAELLHAPPGERVMNVSLNGAVYVTGLDVSRLAGLNRLLYRDLNIAVNTSELKVDFRFALPSYNGSHVAISGISCHILTHRCASRSLAQIVLICVLVPELNQFGNAFGRLETCL